MSPGLRSVKPCSAHSGHVLHRLAAARRDDELVVPQRLDRAVAGGADPDVGDDLPVAVDVRDHARDDGGPGHRVAERGARHRERQHAGEDLTGEPVEAVVVVGADDDELELVRAGSRDDGDGPGPGMRGGSRTRRR